ncbi:exocyst complex component SEC8-like [Gossypium australe]|uniref:Exocyst complex component Sec8 n=1 Tax=Gossypium australe TaxID=47621 RepID=A0A5B6WKN4_9ROSI|nr:exocyst complex component SEC8-like [Gossypium australe]
MEQLMPSYVHETEVGALQDIRSDLSKLQGILFFKILEDLHAHLYNKGEFSSVASSMHEKDDEVPTTTVVAITANSLQPVSLSPVDGRSSYDGHDGDSSLEPNDERHNGGDGKDVKVHQIPLWLFNSTPDEFVETIKKSDAPIHVKYLQTMVECLSLLNKIAAAKFINSSVDKATRTGATSLHLMKGQLESYQLSKQKRQNGISLAGNLLAVSPVSPVMAPTGKAQAAAKELLNSILDSVVRIFGNHIVIGELIESKSSPQSDTKILKSMSTDAYLDSKASHFSIGFSLTVLQSECQQLICEILRATPEAASADAAVQTARLASKAPTIEKRQVTRVPCVMMGQKMASLLLSVSQTPPYQFLTRGGWSKKGSDVSQEGYGSAAVLPEQGMYLAASVYRPVHQFTERLASMLPKRYSQLGNDGLLAFVENFVKDHLLPTMFVDYRKSVQAAISSKFRPAAFRPRAHNHASYASSIEKGRPVLQGLLAIDYLAKEASVLGWAQAIPKFAADLMKYVQTFLERTYERCRTSYMEAVLEKQSYMIIGRHDIDKLMRLDPASACLPNAFSQSNVRNNSSGAGSIEVESELSDLLLNLRPIRQENLIRDNHKIVLLASLSDSLELVQVSPQNVESGKPSQTSSSTARDLALSANEYRKLAIDCLKVLRVEMQLETIFHLQEMTHREYLENQDSEEPDDFVISLTAQITRRDEEIAPFVSGVKRNYIFGGICGTAANASIKALADFKSINLFGVQQICRNSIALEQTLAAIPSIDSEAAQQKLEHALLTFVTEHEQLFTPSEYINLLKVQIPGREVPLDAQDRMKEILSH